MPSRSRDLLALKLKVFRNLACSITCLWQSHISICLYFHKWSCGNVPSFFDFGSTYIELRMASVVGTQLMVWARTPILGTWDLFGTCVCPQQSPPLWTRKIWKSTSCRSYCNCAIQAILTRRFSAFISLRISSKNLQPPTINSKTSTPKP